MSSAKDFTGQTINNLILLQRKRENKRTYYYCHCKLCSGEKWMSSDSVKKSQSCGCLSKANKFIGKDISNQKFGRLTALEPTDRRTSWNGGVIWKCKCDCGNICYVNSGDLVKHMVKSCGCLLKESSSKNYRKAVKHSCLVRNVFNTNLPAIKNIKLHKNNTSGCVGVYWNKANQNWVSEIKFQKKVYYLGSFREEDKDKAIEVRKQAEEKLFGEFLKWYEEHKNENSK